MQQHDRGPTFTPIIGNPEDPPRKRTLVIIYPLVQNINLPGRAPITLPGCPPGTPYVLFDVMTAWVNFDRGDDEGNYLQVPVDPEKTAADILRDTPGVFLADGDYPTDAELEREKEKLREFWVAKVRLGDEVWDRYGDRKKIETASVVGARALGEHRDWLSSDISSITKCGFCQRSIPPTAGRCPHCGAIANVKNAAQALQLTGEQIENALKYGQITPEDLIPKSRAKTVAAPAAESLGADAVTAAELARMRPAPMTVDPGPRHVGGGKRAGG